MWFNCAKRSSHRGILIGIIPSIITWRLWARQCKARMEGVQLSIDSVWMEIKFWIHHVSENLLKVTSLSSTDRKLLNDLEVPIVPVKKRVPKCIKWWRPSAGWVKLNIDGSCQGNPGNCGGGGVICDSTGSLIAAFSESYGFGTNNNRS
ncbi:uncharacterized protein LOC121244564 [Juglans microcarpa x Juglans regia]|uniref:uncharacterized protein LOC121244564 n=1 Tax=Juglans microcarpa x Juglans regia TaxID=2249226 RepID=UPI001B7E6423|nr:uncharacterized protein LOC121244564 [Juglans microcarpa x Juglans regia]